MQHHVCPWWLGYLLVIPLRRWMHNPRSLLAPFVADGMIVLEPGPGMGFFTLELARRVGSSGRVIAVDVQPQMIRGLVRRAKRARLADRLDARLPRGDRLGIEDYSGRIDFALAFAVVHEVTNPAGLLIDIHDGLKPGGKLFLVEPAGHVSAEAFALSLQLANDAGLRMLSRPRVRRSHAAVLAR